MNAAIYARISTADGRQHLDNQLLQLRDYATRAGYTVTGEYTDMISGAKSKRPGLDALLKEVAARRVGVVLAVRLDRIGRSLKHLLEIIETFKHYGVSLVLTTQMIDTSSPAGMLFFQMAGAFAEFERGVFRDRIREGLHRRKLEGHRLGREPLPVAVVDQIRELAAQGVGVCEIARRIRRPKSTVSKTLKNMRRGIRPPQAG